MKGVIIENLTDPSPSPRRADVERRREVDEFVSELDEAFVRQLIEVGALSHGEPETDAGLHEELQWLLRKLGVIAFERDR
jgi:hypothetical protein